MPPFHCVAHDYSHADWDGFRDHLRDVSPEDIFKLCASAPANELCEWLQVGINIDIYSSSYVSGQTSLISMVFSSMCNCHSLKKSLFSTKRI